MSSRIAADSVEENEEAKHLFQKFPINGDQTYLWKNDKFILTQDGASVSNIIILKMIG